MELSVRNGYPVKKCMSQIPLPLGLGLTVDQTLTSEVAVKVMSDSARPGHKNSNTDFLCSLGILVHLDCYNKIPQLEWLIHRFISHCSGDWMSAIRVPECLSEGPLPVINSSFYTYVVERLRELHQISFIRAFTPYRRTLPS